MEESKRMGIPVLGPDINESGHNFTVNAKGEIRFGLAGLKGVGESAVDHIVSEREANGPYSSIFDMMQRINLRAVNKKSMECLAMSGAFDCFQELHRAQYFFRPEGETQTGIERLVRFGNQYQASQSQMAGSLFGDMEMPEVSYPKIPDCDEWTLMIRLEKEREVAGIYLSGHPLDNYKFELKHYRFTPLREVNDYIEEMDVLAKNGDPVKERVFRVAVFVTEALDRISKSGNRYGKLLLQDYSGSREVMLFGEDYLRFSKYLNPGLILNVKGIVQPRQYRQEEVEFRVQKIKLLDETKSKMTGEIEISTAAASLTSEQVHFLTENLSQNPGATHFHLTLMGDTPDWKVSLRSISRKVEMNEALAHFLEEQKNFNIRISINNN